MRVAYCALPLTYLEDEYATLQSMEDWLFFCLADVCTMNA